VKTTRRHVLGLMAALACAPGVAISAAKWPNEKPIRIIVPFPPGGNSDLLARAIGQQLSEKLRQSVVIENRSGAGGSIGAAAAAREAADGYTFLLGDIATQVINELILPKLSYSPENDFVTVSRLTSVSLLFVANPKLGVKSFADFITQAKSNPGKLTYASGGTGTPSHLAMAMLAANAGIELVHVPYRGSAPALNDIIAGEVDVMLDGAATQLVRTGRLQLLGVSGEKSPAFPDAPTIAQAGVANYRFSSWHGIFAPKSTPTEIVNSVASALSDILGQPALKKQFADQNIQLLASNQKAFNDIIKQQKEEFTKLVREQNIKAQS